MILIVNRFTSDEDATISQVFLDGKFICFGLEDEYREDKVVGETRIPAGTYKVGVRKVGSFHKRYQKRFGALHYGMLEIMDVRGFTDVLIHCGNYDRDTSGCLLVGTGAVTTINNMMITNSVVAYRKLYQLVFDAAKCRELLIQFIDADFGSIL